MLLIQPSVQMETSQAVLEDTLQVIEKAGRTCWKSEGKRADKIRQLFDDPTFGPESFKEISGLHLEDWREEDSQQAMAVRYDAASHKVTNDFIRFIAKVGHDSVLEHSAITFRFITDRAVSHQLVRHRIGAYSQESQRYVDYEKSGRMIYILPEDLALPEGEYEWLFPVGEHGGLDRLIRILEPDAPQEPVTGETPVWKCLTGIHGKTENVPISRIQDRTWLQAMQFAENSYMILREAGVKPEDARSVLPNATKTEIVVTFNIRQWRHVLKTRLSPKAQHNIRHLMGKVLQSFMQSPLAVAFEDIHA